MHLVWRETVVFAGCYTQKIKIARETRKPEPGLLDHRQYLVRSCVVCTFVRVRGRG
jgi:hypothetical protein